MAWELQNPAIFFNTLRTQFTSPHDFGWQVGFIDLAIRAPMKSALKKAHICTLAYTWLEKLIMQFSVTFKGIGGHKSASHPAKYVCQIISSWGVTNSDERLETISSSSRARPTVRPMPNGNILNSS